MIGKDLGHYRILDKLGQGGMGEVYRAEDTSLKRQVALKVLPVEMAANQERLERFQREAETLASIDHPNIVTIYSIEAADGERFLTMQLVEGQSLSELIPGQGMSLDQVFEIAIPLADALAASHERGIVHRDLKPANIMVTETGQVKVLDFGLAKLRLEVDAHDSSHLATEALTGEGRILGTMPYMSPEQLEGKDVDARSDIFSLGVILQEMATGERPFGGDSPASLISSIMLAAPPEIETERPDLPRHFSRIVRHCLEKNPDDRFQTAKDIRNQLRDLQRETVSQELPAPPPVAAKRSVSGGWIAAAGVALVIMVFGAIALWQKRSPKQPPAPEDSAIVGQTDDRKLVVVLPFENLGDTDDEYFADGMTEEITSRLAVLNGLAVISRTTAMQYKASRPALKQIGEELGVDYVLEGTVRWQRSDEGASQVRVTPQLIRVSDDTHLWAERYDAVLADIFQVQSDIAKKVSDQLGMTLLETQIASIDSQPTQSLEAYDYFLRGNDYAHRGRELTSAKEIKIALEMYEKAVEIDPRFAVALARLGLAHSWLYEYYFDRTEQRLLLAKSAADRALALDSDLPEAHLALGAYYYVGGGTYEQALDQLEFVQTHQPNNGDALATLGAVQAGLGDFEAARATLEKAWELNPRDGRYPCSAGGACIALRRYQKAIDFHDHAIRLTPDRPCMYFCEVWIYLAWDGTTQRARAFLDSIPANVELEATPPINYPWVLADLFDGEYEDALVRLDSGDAEAFSFHFFYVPKAQLRAQILELTDQSELATAHYERARQLVEHQIDENPDDERFRGALGIAYAGLGRPEDAVREGRRSLELMGDIRDERFGFRLKDLAQIYVMVGDYDAAFEPLEALLANPTFTSAKSLQADPTWAPLLEDPRFEALLQKYEG